MESHNYEHYRNLTLMFFFEKLLEKGGEWEENCFNSLMSIPYLIEFNFKLHNFPMLTAVWICAS